MPSTMWGCVLLFTFFLTAYGSVSDKLESDFFDNPEITLQLSHSFDNPDAGVLNFVPRGSITIRNFRGPRFTSSQKDLTLNDLNQLKKIASEDGYYFLKTTIKTPSGEQSYRSFTHAKSLLDSGLSDIVRVNLNPNGDIISVSYAMARNDFYSVPHHLGSNRPPPQKFNTTILVHHGETGPMPDTAPYLEKLEHERLAKERGEDPRDNRSFFAKYWMYIVPIALLVLLSGASNPEEGGR
ncbi:unnamed protein product [Orchesella dallaii]|uniref:ER membrane protein complex subunit 10 n=1 Tax=Orchesella dallaii TaxID=48710 RepID=A0ABP1PQ96_9HEXA